ncbi:MAG: peptide ABC transporter substrate-binding protein [Lentisphaeria bacterium]|nr:peptide ABC transporter substrate-binding protein [Lentisphaeria bacterium]
MIHKALLSICYLTACVSTALAERPQWEQDLLPEDDDWKKTEQVFRFNNGTEPESLDIHLATDSASIRLLLSLYEGLTVLDPLSLSPQPGLAASWEVSDDQKTWTFKLRAGLKWSDGSTITAKDFTYAWQRALTPATGCSYANMLFFIENAEAFFKGDLPFDKVGVKAINDQELQIKLKGPTPYLLDILSFPTFFPLNRKVDRSDVAWSKKNHISNGPFILKDWKVRARMTLIPNPHYRDREIVKLKEIHVLPLDNMNTAYQMFLKGELDWLPTIPQARFEEVQRHPDYYVAPYFGTYFIRFNVEQPPFDDVKVRQALAYGTNKKQITGEILRGGQFPVGNFCPKIPAIGYEAPAGLPYDLNKAKQLIAASKYGPGKVPMPNVSYLYNTSEAHKIVAEALTQQWKEKFGISMIAQNMEWKVFLKEMKNLNFQVCRSSWIGDYGDPSTFYDIFLSYSGNNRTGWANKEYDKLAEKASQESNTQKRLNYFKRMEVILTQEDCPILPIYRYVSQGMITEDVFGLEMNFRNLVYLKYIWLEKE